LNFNWPHAYHVTKQLECDTIKKTRIILLLTRIMSFHVYVLEGYDICMVRCDAQHWNSTNHAYVISL